MHQGLRTRSSCKKAKPPSMTTVDMRTFYARWRRGNKTAKQAYVEHYGDCHGVHVQACAFGEGVTVSRPFMKDDIIGGKPLPDKTAMPYDTFYFGDIISSDDRSIPATKAIGCPNRHSNTYADDCCVLGYINDLTVSIVGGGLGGVLGPYKVIKTGAEPNVGLKLKPNGLHRDEFTLQQVVALVDIATGDRLSMAYGASYWHHNIKAKNAELQKNTADPSATSSSSATVASIGAAAGAGAVSRNHHGAVSSRATGASSQ